MDTPEDIQKILGPNEKVELFIQEKLYHPAINIDSLIVTNERVILRHPHALGLKKNYTDYSYSEISGVELDKGVLRSKMLFKLKHSPEPLEVGELPNDLAEQAYGIIRENIGRFQAPFSTGNATVPVEVEPRK